MSLQHSPRKMDGQVLTPCFLFFLFFERHTRVMLPEVVVVVVPLVCQTTGTDKQGVILWHSLRKVYAWSLNCKCLAAGGVYCGPAGDSQWKGHKHYPEESANHPHNLLDQKIIRCGTKEKRENATCLRLWVNWRSMSCVYCRDTYPLILCTPATRNEVNPI